jgi:hypothetical protein
VSAVTQTDPDDRARIAAIDFTHRLVRNWQEAHEIELLGAYLIGSLAHAGFSRRYSDVDIALITTAGLSPPALDRLRSNAVALSAEWGPKVSIFWADQHFSLGRFPPLDRVDYLDHAVVLMERQSVRPTRPTMDEIRLYLSGTPFGSWADLARSFAVAEMLEPKDHKAYLRTLLYPARFCYSWTTGLAGSNDDAVAFLDERPVAGLDIRLITRALQCRRAAADPDDLFPARAILLTQIDACAALLASAGGQPR